METPFVSRQDLEKHLMEKAMKDEIFRDRLIENPQVVIEEETGLKIPSSSSLQVLEESHSEIYLVLPMRPVQEPGSELSELDLTSVAAAGQTAGCRTWDFICLWNTSSPQCHHVQ